MSIKNLSVPNQYTVCCKCFTCANDTMTFGDSQGDSLLNFNSAGATMDFAHCTVLNFPGGGITPLPIFTQMVYVNQGGNDTTGNGSILEPYATVLKALSSITDASTTKVYNIIVGPGNYNDNLSLKANVNISGSGNWLVATNLNGTIDLNDPSWVNSNSNGCILQGLTLNGSSVIFDFTLNGGSPESSIYLFESYVTNSFTMNAESGDNMAVIRGCTLNSFTQNGMNTYMFGTENFGDVNMNLNGIIGATGEFSASNIDGSLILTAGPFIQTVDVTLYSCSIGNMLTANNGHCHISATIDSVPIPANVSLSGAILTYLNVNTLGNSSQWSDVIISSPSSNQILQYNGSKWVNNSINLQGSNKPVIVIPPETATLNLANSDSGTSLFIQNIVSQTVNLPASPNIGCYFEFLGISTNIAQFQISSSLAYILLSENHSVAGVLNTSNQADKTHLIAAIGNLSYGDYCYIIWNGFNWIARLSSSIGTWSFS